VGRLKERTPELRDRVLQVAVTMVDDGGVAAFTARRVAAAAQTSTPAVYELFGDKGGLVREVFFEGFRMLGGWLERIPDSADPRVDLETVVSVLRSFVIEHPVLGEVMFSRPFADFDPRPDESEAGRSIREAVLRRVRRCIGDGVIAGNETDIAHVLLALAHGLSAQENAGWLGTSKTSRDRRWALAVSAALDGMRPPLS
jgi:AcrR family transcriptional regulator